MICPDGSSYEGAWQHDSRSGAGVATFVLPSQSTTTVPTLEGTATDYNDSPQTMETPVKPDSSVVAAATATTTASYSGNWKNDTFHGTGCYTYPDRTTLSGEFVNGNLCNGHGLVRYTSARSERTKETSIYVGDIVDYKRHGQGTYTKADGTTYTGTWAHHRRSGHGLLTHPCGRKMEGTFKNGVLDGQGTITQSDPTLFDYIGAFVQGVPQGEGTQTQRTTGNSYKGSFVDGKRHGQGKFVYGDSKTSVESLEGTWKENRLIGQGRQVNRDGSFIVGTFKHNKVQGELIYPDGEKFAGLLATIPPYAVTGRGTVRTNNSLYKGELANGKKQGPGVYTFNVPNDSDKPVEDMKTQTYTGLFVDNKMHGRGVLTCSEGSASGEFRDDLLYNGSGKLYVGSVLQWGRWVDGVRQNVAPTIVSNDAVETAVDGPGANKASGDIALSQNPSHPVVQTINSQNMLQGYYTLQVTSSATITGHFVDNYLVGHGVYTHKRNHRTVIYKGPFLHNKPHGNGVTTTKDGLWQSTFEHGTQKFGTFTNHEGTHKYVGETEGFNFNGKGKYEYPGYTYDGDFKMGARHGYGVFTKKDVFFYAGNWVENKRHGYGVNVNKQHTYKGMHYNDLQHGEGELIYNQGYTYKGTFLKGYLANGIITTAWGDSHSGEFTRGVRSGKGVFTFSDGVSISGTWVAGKLQGVATISSPPAASSVNNEDNKDNKESDVVPTTSAAHAHIAKGYFENNVLQYQVNDNNAADHDHNADSLWNTLPVLNNDNMFAPARGFLSHQVVSEYGQGRIHFSDKRVYVGVVSDGKMNGTGVLYSGPSDAKTAPYGKYRLQGVFQNNLPYNCKGGLMDRGTLFEGTWTDGVRQGYAKIVQSNGRLLEGEYVNGESFCTCTFCMCTFGIRIQFFASYSTRTMIIYTQASLQLQRMWKTRMFLAQWSLR